MAELEFIGTAGVRVLAEVQSRNLIRGQSVEMANPMRAPTRGGDEAAA